MHPLLLVAFTLWFAACVPVVTPPARVRAAVGPTFGTDARGRPVDRVLAHGAIAFHPLQLVPDASRGPLDLGLGYQLQGVQGDARPVGVDAQPPVDPDPIAGSGLDVHGPELEVGFYPWRPAVGGKHLQVGAFAASELLLTDTPGSLLGYGATLGLAVELADYGFYPVAHKDDDASYVGLVGGQWGMGLYAGANLRDIGQGRYYAVTIGVSGRIPFSIGVLCCIDPTERKRRKRR